MAGASFSQRTASPPIKLKVINLFSGIAGGFSYASARLSYPPRRVFFSVEMIFEIPEAWTARTDKQIQTVRSGQFKGSWWRFSSADFTVSKGHVVITPLSNWNDPKSDHQFVPMRRDKSICTETVFYANSLNQNTIKTCWDAWKQEFGSSDWVRFLSHWIIKYLFSKFKIRPL